MAGSRIPCMRLCPWFIPILRVRDYEPQSSAECEQLRATCSSCEPPSKAENTQLCATSWRYVKSELRGSLRPEVRAQDDRGMLARAAIQNSKSKEGNHHREHGERREKHRAILRDLCTTIERIPHSLYKFVVHGVNTCLVAASPRCGLCGEVFCGAALPRRGDRKSKMDLAGFKNRGGSPTSAGCPLPAPIFRGGQDGDDFKID